MIDADSGIQQAFALKLRADLTGDWAGCVVSGGIPRLVSNWPDHPFAGIAHRNNQNWQSETGVAAVESHTQ
jgi:hypothetical protein